MFHGEKREVFVKPSQHFTVFKEEGDNLVAGINSKPTEQIVSKPRNKIDFLVGITCSLLWVKRK